MDMFLHYLTVQHSNNVASQQGEDSWSDFGIY